MSTCICLATEQSSNRARTRSRAHSSLERLIEFEIKEINNNQKKRVDNYNNNIHTLTSSSSLSHRRRVMSALYGFFVVLENFRWENRHLRTIHWPLIHSFTQLIGGTKERTFEMRCVGHPSPERVWFWPLDGRAIVWTDQRTVKHSCTILTRSQRQTGIGH